MNKLIRSIVKGILRYPLGALNPMVMKSKYRPKLDGNLDVDRLMEDDKKKKILVLAPHVDDETIGLGASLLKHIKAGHEVRTVYITDGAGSATDLSVEELKAERKREAHIIRDMIGISQVYFLDQPDGSTENSEEVRSELGEIISSYGPDVIYSPFLIDGNPDHVETTRILGDVLGQVDKDKQIEVLLYEINCPIEIGAITDLVTMDVDIYDKKVKLLEVFESQSAMEFDGFLLLNRMKARLIGQGYGSEVFVRTDGPGIQEMKRALDAKGFSYSQFRQLSGRYNLLLGYYTGIDKKKVYTEAIREVLKK